MDNLKGRIDVGEAGILHRGKDVLVAERGHKEPRVEGVLDNLI